MKNLFRSTFAFALMVFILVLAPAAFAQEPTFGLSAEDYTLWTTANATSAAFDSVTVDFSVSLNVPGQGDAGVTASLTGSSVIGGLSGSPIFQMDVVGEIAQGTEIQPVDFKVILIENFLYYDLGDGNGWLQTTADELTSAFASGLGPDVAGILPLGGMMGGDDAAAGAGMPDLGALMGGIDPNGFVAITRTDSGDLAQFSADLNVAEALRQTGLAGMLGGAVLGGGADTEMSAEQAQQMEGFMMQMLAPVKLNISQFVDPATSLVEQTVIDFSFEMGPETAIVINFDIDVTSYNEPVTVTAPERFTVAPSSS